MVLNVANVLFLLLKYYSIQIPDDPLVSRQEKKLARVLCNIMDQSKEGDVMIEETEEVIDEESGDWEPEEFQPYDDFVLPSLDWLKFGEKAVSRQDAQTAIDYYRNTTKGFRSLDSMKSRFRWITDAKHIDKLRAYEKEKNEFKETRTDLLKLLSNRLFEVVQDKLKTGFSLHDLDLQRFALRINNKETKIQEFKASESWITSWKKSHRIVSRKITKFVTRKCMVDKELIKKKAEDFVKVCRREMSLFSPSMIFNSDQTGVQKELYGARSLAFLGEKNVERLIQSKSSLTHSFTFLPMLFMDGTMGPKAFMVLAEPSGDFPPSRPIPNCPNLEVRAGKSHIMTKDLMRDWLKSCVFIPENPKKMYMLIDSWPSFTDHTSINQCIPSGFDVTIRNIPPHTTGLIQPLDAHWNGPFKNLLKKFMSYALAFHTDYIIAQRNNEIWMISLLFHQISSDYFKPFLQYSWKKTGYIDSSSGFETPAKFCFDQVGDKACHEPGCPELSFIRCSRCKEYICFNHFIVVDKHLCPHK